MWPFLAEHAVFPLGDIAVGTSVMKYYHWLQKTQWWSVDRLRELQDARLRALVAHAYNNVPYYSKLFHDRGLTNNDIETVGDLSKIPILTRGDVRRNQKDMLARDFKRWKPIPDATGGSTGEPLRYYITKDLASINWAGIFRAWNWGGYRIGEKRIAFGGSSLVPNSKPTIFDRTRDGLERNLRISAVSMTDKKYGECVGRIREYGSRFIYGYPSAVYLLADYCRSKNIHDLRFESVFSTAEVLLPHYRAAIEDQFHCRVFDEYGSYDGGGQAMECEQHHGLHISAEKVVLEVVDEEGKRVPAGESGRIIVTDLNNYAMPFVRYEVGDTGVLARQPCPCGRGLPLLQTLEGRIPDTIRFSNGVSLSGAAVPCMLKERHIKQYQLVQTAKDTLVVRLVKDTDYSDVDTDYILNVLGHHCGKDVKVELEFRKDIPVGENGKHRFILSLR